MTHTINWFVQGFLPVIVPWMGWKWLLSENDTPSYSVSGCLQTIFIVIAWNSMTFATKIFWRGKTIIAFYMKSTNTTHNVRIRWFEVLRLFRVCSILFFVIDFGLMLSNEKKTSVSVCFVMGRYPPNVTWMVAVMHSSSLWNIFFHRKNNKQSSKGEFTCVSFPVLELFERNLYYICMKMWRIYSNILIRNFYRIFFL